ncbi:MAG TPA: hypothetical protein VFL03_03690 [Candidatus Limnocylindrales bacterium]|nr:hypothetical protein [Candidatus Limnocylindrales bacterium]
MTTAPIPEATASGPIRRLSARLPEGLVDAAWLWLVLRVGLGLIALFVLIQGKAATACPRDPETLAFLPDAGPLHVLFGIWHQWDACWYTTIAAFGYGPGAGETTFFPLLPVLLAGGTGTLAGIVLVAPIVTAIACIAAFTGLRQLVGRDVDVPTAERTVLYTAVFPSALFLIAPFTESLFLATSVWAFIGARRRRWELVLVAGLLAGLTRPQGILLVLPLAWEAFQALRSRWAAGGRRLQPSDVLVAVAVAAPVIAYVGFVAWTALVAGESYFASNEAWGSHHLTWPWERLGDGIAWAIEHGRPVQALNAGLWVLFVGLTIAAIRLLPTSYWIYVVPQLVIALTQDTVFPLMSTVRYLIVLFPCFVVLAMAGRSRRFNTAWVVISVLLLGFVATQFVQGVMVG